MDEHTNRRAIISLFRRIVYSIEPSDEPWFDKQYYAFAVSDEIDFDLLKALQCLALMYWKGMDSMYAKTIEEATGQEVILENDTDWINSYIDHIITPQSIGALIIDVSDFQEHSETPCTNRLLFNDLYFTNSVSESGTSETGKIITFNEVGLNNIFQTVKPSLTFSELIKYTTARLNNLPVLKDLGILQIQDCTVQNDYPMYCWLEDCNDQDHYNLRYDLRYNRYLLIPFKTKQMAEAHARDFNNLHSLISDDPDASTTRIYVICMRDMIVKITPDKRIYSKVKKTYYTIQKMPEYLQPISANRNLTKEQQQQCVRIIVAKELLELDKKIYCFGITTKNMIHPMYYKNSHSEAMYSVPSPDLLSKEDKDWLVGLKNHKLMDAVGHRINYDRLITEYT